MKLWTTSIRAIDPKTRELKNWCGPHVPGINAQTAQEYCENNGLGYCKVDGELIAEIPFNTAGTEGMIDYDNIQNN